MKVTVAVAAHKNYRMPREACYLPVQAGRAGKASIGFAGDDTGDNISEKNPYYCELTVLYWLWKNDASDYIGLVHYRRYLGGRRSSGDPFGRILTEREILEHMGRADILLPRRRNYYIESVYAHYAHTHYPEHLDIARDVIAERCPDYLAAFDRVMRRRSAHMFNMFIMSRPRAELYCGWLFDILGEMENRIDVGALDPFQARVYGRVSELLLDVWLEKNGFAYEEAPLVYMEKKHTARKLGQFIRSRLLGEKYRKSQ